MRKYLFQSVVDFVALILGLHLVAIVAVIANGDITAADMVAAFQPDWALWTDLLAFSIVLTAVHWFVRPLLEIALADTPIGTTRRRTTRLVYGRSNPLDGLSTPETIRVMLQQLGPTYVKLGQMASSQSESLPPELAAELVKLQSRVPPVPYEQ